MAAVLTPTDVEQLVASVDVNVRAAGCDRTLRFTEQWAADNEVNWHDLVDVLEANSVFCDCEVVLNITAECQRELPPEKPLATNENPWLIPSDFSPTHDTFTKQLICQAELARNTYSDDGEPLVPPPHASKPRKRMRRSVHFFVGLNTGLPSEIGVVAEKSPTSAADFAELVRSSKLPEFETFSVHEAAFFLSKLVNLKVGTPVGTHFMDKLTVQCQKSHELRIHKVFLRT